MLTDDELTRLAETALDRVNGLGAADGDAPGCQVDHLAITRVGIEEGLKLAARLLHEQSVRPTAPAPDPTPVDSRGSRGNL